MPHETTRASHLICSGFAALRLRRRPKLFTPERAKAKRVASAQCFRGRRCGGSLWCHPRQSERKRSESRALSVSAVAAAAAPSGVIHARASESEASRERSILTPLSSPRFIRGEAGQSERERSQSRARPLTPLSPPRFIRGEAGQSEGAARAALERSNQCATRCPRYIETSATFASTVAASRASRFNRSNGSVFDKRMFAHQSPASIESPSSSYVLAFG